MNPPPLPMRDWWVCSPYGRLPWWRLAGLSPLALQLYALLLELAEPAPNVVAHPRSCEHAVEIVTGWSLTELGRQLGRTEATISRARRELEAVGLVELLSPAGESSPCNVYGVTRGVYGGSCPADRTPKGPDPSRRQGS